MRLDLYTKAVLSVIALALVMIACNQYVHPQTTASAQAQFAGVQFAIGEGGLVFFDTRSGEVWAYEGQTGALGNLD
jgi:hypothetical protein